MAPAKKDHLQNECAVMAIIQASAFYDQDLVGPSLIHTSSDSSPENHIYGGAYRNSDSPEKAAKNFSLSNSSTVSSPSSTNSNGLGYHHTAYSVAEEGSSGITFRVNAGSLLNFDQTKRLQGNLMNPKIISEEDEYPMWAGHYQSQMNVGPPETSSSHHAATEQWELLNDQEENGVLERGGREVANNKRPSTEGNLQALKKQCVPTSNKKPKPKVAVDCKDPQSVAATVWFSW